MNKNNFIEDKNTAVFSLKKIIFSKEPILKVYHDCDGDWQFLGSEINLDMAESALVSLEEIVELDFTVLEVSDLDYGWMAYREDIGMPWIREKIEDEN